MGAFEKVSFFKNRLSFHFLLPIRDPGFGFVDGFIPAKPNEYNYGDLTNDGVFPGRNPNDMQIEEMDYIVAKATDLLVRYETQSPSTEFELTCKRIEDHQRSIANGT